jgi:hypothetical protein
MSLTRGGSNIPGKLYKTSQWLRTLVNIKEVVVAHTFARRSMIVVRTSPNLNDQSTGNDDKRGGFEAPSATVGPLTSDPLITLLQGQSPRPPELCTRFMRPWSHQLHRFN